MKFSKFLVVSLLVLMGATFGAYDKNENEEKNLPKTGVHRVEIELKSSSELDYILQIIPTSDNGVCDLFYELENGSDDDASDFSGSVRVGNMLQEISNVDGIKKFVYFTSNNCTNLNVSLSLMAAFELVEYSYSVKFFIDGKGFTPYEDEGKTDRSIQVMFSSSESQQ